ncbi:hypothetical protein [Micromonospora foliorum]|uniref:hypothetical protein n=1 Tax=Micromonospora foliorum TaxID=2911210 RepID=UPI001EE7BA59|nr:hypothetical protein [Micromonospora foliorum]MCG5435375.1 hypothetical protein [Micromonospora foliorum]
MSPRSEAEASAPAAACAEPVSVDGSRTELAQVVAQPERGVDSNLVLTQAGFPLWDTETRGNPGAHVILQTDGNLVVYSRDGTPVWHTNTRGSNASQLVLRDNGDLVLLDPGGTVIWHR